MKIDDKNRGITPEMAQRKLAELGITISLSKAASVLDFMYKMAILEVERFNSKK